MYTLLIRGLEFYAHHGVPDEEQVVGHRYKVDLELELDGSADETDHISDTVDYGSVAAVVTATAQGHRYRTFERLARVLAGRLLQEYTPVQAVTITLVKRLPPAAIIAEEAGVRIVLRR